MADGPTTACLSNPWLPTFLPSISNSYLSPSYLHIFPSSRLPIFPSYQLPIFLSSYLPVFRLPVFLPSFIFLHTFLLIPLLTSSLPSCLPSFTFCCTSTSHPTPIPATQLHYKSRPSVCLCPVDPLLRNHR